MGDAEDLGDLNDTDGQQRAVLIVSTIWELR
jgi:hypothetical protein